MYQLQHPADDVDDSLVLADDDSSIIQAAVRVLYCIANVQSQNQLMNEAKIKVLFQ